jgi:tetratricopeptide (TPR) repeat protein
MHRTFFTGAGELDGYDAHQPRLTRIFTTGRYNCLSSALLFIVLGRAFDLPVRGVSTPTHAFVELGAPGTRPIEIETTSSLGFDLVHDRKFFAEQAAAWSARRGLPPLSFEDYQRRQVLTPAGLVALAMRNELPGSSEEDQLRLAEVAAAVDPDSVEIQRNRLTVYALEAGRLRDKGAWPTMIRFLDLVSPVVVELAARQRDTVSQSIAAWLNWYRGDALMNVGRQDEAMAVFEAGVDRIDPRWEDAAALRNNYWALFTQRLIRLLDSKSFPQAEQLVLRHLEKCRADDTCAANAEVMYGNWAVEHYNVGNWPAARQVLQNCVARLPSAAECRSRLEEIESQHRF